MAWTEQDTAEQEARNAERTRLLASVGVSTFCCMSLSTWAFEVVLRPWVENW